MGEFIILAEKAPQMSLCSICPRPGVCCEYFTLVASFWEDDTPEEIQKQVGVDHFHPVRMGSNVHLDPETGKRYGYWMFTCSKLKDGRCSIYDKRPSTCREFVPTTGNGLCAFDEGHPENQEYLMKEFGHGNP